MTRRADSETGQKRPMARQDINEALAQTGFLYGGPNAAYIE